MKAHLLVKQPTNQPTKQTTKQTTTNPPVGTLGGLQCGLYHGPPLMLSLFWIRWMAQVEFDMSNMALQGIAGSNREVFKLPFNYVNTSAFVLCQTLPLFLSSLLLATLSFIFCSSFQTSTCLWNTNILVGIYTWSVKLTTCLTPQNLVEITPNSAYGWR